MLGIYFTGSGNSKYALEIFMNTLDEDNVISIESNKIIEEINKNEYLVFSYPVQYSTVPKIVRDFIIENSSLWKGKKIFIIATMALFSGDGAGVLARLLKKYNAKIIGGLHLKMPDSIADEKVLKRSFDKNARIVKASKDKTIKAAKCFALGKPTKEGLDMFSRVIGFFGQRIFFGYKTKNYTDKLKIDSLKCIKCKKCINICPMNNIELVYDKVKGKDKCTMCYRCINYCPNKAITLLGKNVVYQNKIDNYL